MLHHFNVVVQVMSDLNHIKLLFSLTDPSFGWSSF